MEEDRHPQDLQSRDSSFRGVTRVNFQNSKLYTTSVLKSALLRSIPFSLRVNAWLPAVAVLKLCLPNLSSPLKAPPASALSPSLPQVPCLAVSQHTLLPACSCPGIFALDLFPARIFLFPYIYVLLLLECPFVSLAFLLSIKW